MIIISITKIFSVFLTQYHSGDQIENSEMGGACGMYRGGSRGVYRVLLGKPEGNIPLGRIRRRREDNIKMDFQEL